MGTEDLPPPGPALPQRREHRWRHYVRLIGERLGSLLRGRRGETPSDVGTFSHGFNVVYTRREVKQLRRYLGERPRSEPSGRGLCPYCLHTEARWRTEERTVRVRCSQCQRFTVYELPESRP